MTNKIEDNTSKITYLFLRKLGVRVTKVFLRKEIQSHPFYPSLAAISDILALYKVENSGLRISIDEIDKISLPFIVHLSIHQGTFAVVENISATGLTLTLDEKTSKVFSKEDFIKIWDNVILTANVTEKSGEPNYSQNQKNELITAIKLPVLIILIAIFLASSLAINHSTIYYLPLFATKCIGFFFIWLLIKHELGVQSELTNRLCTMSKSAGCNEVLKSKASNLFGIIQLVDIGLVWFMSSFVFLLINSFEAIDVKDLNLLGLFSILSLPFIFFSFGYQIFIVKKYCPLCIGVMSSLLVECVLFLTYYHFSFELPGIGSLLLFASLLTGIVYIWSLIKPYLIIRDKFMNIEIQYLNLKRHPNVINSILAEGMDYNISTISNPIRINNTENDIVITEIINPFCNPCNVAFTKAEHLINESNGSCPVVQFVFMTPSENKENIMAKTAMHMLAFAEQNTVELTKTALSEWFKLMDYEIWSEKYPAKIEESHFVTLKNHFRWAADNKIEGTPTTFVNSKMLLSKIDFADLKYIIN